MTEQLANAVDPRELANAQMKAAQEAVARMEPWRLAEIRHEHSIVPQTAKEAA